MIQLLRFFLFCFFLFFSFNIFGQSTIKKLEKRSSNTQHIQTKKLILATPTSVVKHKYDKKKYPEKPKKEEKNKDPQLPKTKQAIIYEKNNPK